MPQGKFAKAPRGGGSARACILYLLGEESTRKVTHERIDDSLHASQKTDVTALFAEARARPDFGVGTVWSPISGGGKRPSSVYARGVWSLETAAFDIESVCQAQPRVKQPVQHIILSLTEKESALVNDERFMKIAEWVVNRIGLADHQAIFSIHRDTDNAHCHIAVASVHPFTLKAWNKHQSWSRLHWALREAEVKFGLSFEHGLAVVRDQGESTQRIEWATKAERLAWARARDIAGERLEDLARSHVSDHHGLELPEDRRERVATAIKGMLQKTRERGVEPLRADVYRIAAELAVTIEGWDDGALRIRLMDRAPKGMVARSGSDEFGFRVERLQRWVPSDDVFDIPFAQLTALKHQREWLSDLGDLDRSEREVEEFVRANPSRPIDDIIADGKALFGDEELNDWACSRLSVGGPELAEWVAKNNPILDVRSIDTKHPLYTTKAQLALERGVLTFAERFAQERDPRFDRAALDRAIADEEADLSRVHARRIVFSAEQRAVFDLLEYRFGVLQGPPGSAKSSIMSVVRRYCELTGRPIVGLATAQLAAENLGELAKMRSVNSTRGLVLEKARGEELIHPGAWVLADESSMFALEDADAIFERLSRYPDACALYLGGESQLPNMAAGDTLRVLTAAAKQYGRYRELTEVFRQRDEGALAWMREMIPRFDRAIRENDALGVAACLQELIDRGHIVFHRTRWDEVHARAADLVEAARRGETYVAPGFSHIEAKFVNRAIREALGQKSLRYELEERVRYFDVGDRVRFTKNAEEALGVLNGYRGTVRAVTMHRIDVELDKNRRVVSVDPRKYPHLEWAWALTTHAAQGQGVEVVYPSLTLQDSTRSAFVALTRGELGLTAHTHLKPEELIKHLTSPAAMRPKEDALLYEEFVERTGGKYTFWATATRRALENEADPLHQQYAREMRDLYEQRGRVVYDVLTRYQAQLAQATSIADEPRRSKREATLDALKDRDLMRVDAEFKSPSFVSWSIKNKRAIEQDAIRLDRLVEEEERRREQRERFEVKRALDLARYRERMETVTQESADEQAKKVAAALRGSVSLEGTLGEAYLRGRGCHGLAVDARYHPNFFEGCQTAQGNISPGMGPAVVFLLRDDAGAVAAIQARFLDPRPSSQKVLTVGKAGNAAYRTPDATRAYIVGIAESPIDALSLAEVGLPSYGLAGAGNRPAWLAHELRAREVVIATDADAAGDRAALRLYRPDDSSYSLAVILADDCALARLSLPPGVKDPNEALQRDRDAFRASVAIAANEAYFSTGRAWWKAWKESPLACTPPCGIERYADRRKVDPIFVHERMYERALEIDAQELEETRQRWRSEDRGRGR